MFSQTTQNSFDVLNMLLHIIEINDDVIQINYDNEI